MRQLLLKCLDALNLSASFESFGTCKIHEAVFPYFKLFGPLSIEAAQ